MTNRSLYLAADLPDTTNVLADGTMWSHVATLGRRIKDTAFTIDQAVIDNMIRVYKTGYPRKVVVDYEHGTANGATDRGAPVRAAGQVYDLKGVYSAADFEGDLKATAEKLTAKVGRPLDDPRNMGLWMRWWPTASALQMITAREYTELSICYAHDYQHNVTGEAQGPTILSVALTNTPFLDDMLPVAASRDNDRGTSTDLDERRSPTMPVPQMLQRAAALFGRAFTTEEEVVAAAEERITALKSENDSFKPKASAYDAIVAEIGETDAAKVPAAIRALKATAETARREKEEQIKKANETSRDAILLKHEKRLTPAQKEYFGVQLVAELSAGVKAGETKTEKVIESLPENKALGRTSAADGGKDAPTDRDARVQLRANELMESNPAIKRQAEKDDYGAFKRALRMASSEIPHDEDKK